MEIKKADSKGRVTGFTPDTHYFVSGPLDGSYTVKEVPVVDEMPEGYESAEIGDAKNAVLDLLHMNDDIDPEEVDLIGLSDSIIEELLRTGIGKTVQW